MVAKSVDREPSGRGVESVGDKRRAQLNVVLATVLLSKASLSLTSSKEALGGGGFGGNGLHALSSKLSS